MDNNKIKFFKNIITKLKDILKRKKVVIATIGGIVVALLVICICVFTTQKAEDIVETETKTTTLETITSEPETTTEETTADISYDTWAENIEEPVNNVGFVNETNIYRYCPSVINGNIFYCANEIHQGEVRDGIYLNNTLVLDVTPGSWDSAQVCDPSVVAGDFVFNGVNYCYLMAYLGCATYDCTANEVGLAVSNDLYNWTKVGRVECATYDGFWGVGQPSIINYDGKIYLFYTSGTAAKTTTYVDVLDCKNLNQIAYLDKAEVRISGSHVSNADFAYSDGVLYMTCDTHPFSDGPLSIVTDAQSIYKSAFTGDIHNLSFTLIDQISAANTGHKKNHNAGFDRGAYGELNSNTVYVTTADEVGGFLDNLFTYRFSPFSFVG